MIRFWDFQLPGASPLLSWVVSPAKAARNRGLYGRSVTWYLRILVPYPLQAT